MRRIRAAWTISLPGCASCSNASPTSPCISCRTGGAATASCRTATHESDGRHIDDTTFTFSDASLTTAPAGFGEHVHQANPANQMERCMAAVQDTGSVAQVKVRRISWTGMIPFVAIHLLAFGSIWTGVTPAAAICCAVLYVVRMFAVTGGYH